MEADKLTELRRLVNGVYIDQQIIVIEDFEFENYTSVTLHREGDCFVPGYELRFEYHKHALHLKPLSDISDEDGEYVCAIKYGKEQVTQWLTYQKALRNTFKEALKGILLPIEQRGSCSHIEIIDYLRLRGYALPYGQWSVNELIEFGIFKLAENGNN